MLSGVGGGNGGASWSLCSPQQLGIIQTSGHQTGQATPILQNIALPAIINNAQPIELTAATAGNGGNGGNYIITSQLVNNGTGMRPAELSFLTDPSSMIGTGGGGGNVVGSTGAPTTLKLIGQVDLSSAGTPKSISLLDAQQLHAQPIVQQPQFAELKTVGLLNSDSFMSKCLLVLK